MRWEPVAPPKMISILLRPALPPLSNPDEASPTVTAIARACSLHADYIKENVQLIDGMRQFLIFLKVRHSRMSLAGIVRP